MIQTIHSGRFNYASKVRKIDEEYDEYDRNLIFFKFHRIDPGMLPGGSRHQVTSEATTNEQFR